MQKVVGESVKIEEEIWKTYKTELEDEYRRQIQVLDQEV